MEEEFTIEDSIVKYMAGEYLFDEELEMLQKFFAEGLRDVTDILENRYESWD